MGFFGEGEDGCGGVCGGGGGGGVQVDVGIINDASHPFLNTSFHQSECVPMHVCCGQFAASPVVSRRGDEAEEEDVKTLDVSRPQAPNASYRQQRLTFYCQQKTQLPSSPRLLGVKRV